MSESRFVDAKAERLSLSGGDWIEVRRRLSGADTRRFQTAGFTRVVPPSGDQKAEIAVDFATAALARTVAYLIDWSFKDASGTRVPCTKDAIYRLDEATLKEIEDALDKHEARLEAESKLPSGEPESSQG